MTCTYVRGIDCLTPKTCGRANACVGVSRTKGKKPAGPVEYTMPLTQAEAWAVLAQAAQTKERPTDAAPAAVDGKGLRYNAGKRDFTLIPNDALAYLADLFTIGARKYAPRNWERGMKYSNVMTSLDRHWNAFKSGEDRDPESTLYHMVHVCWNAMALLTYQLRGIGEDDRYKNPLPPTPDYDAINAGGNGNRTPLWGVMKTGTVEAPGPDIHIEVG